jgi:uncharacterized protein
MFCPAAMSAALWLEPHGLTNTNRISMSDPAPKFSDPYYLCQRCGNCCRWPGDVHVAPADITAISEFIGVTETVFIERYTRVNQKRNGLSIIDKPNGECIFLEGKNVCSIQAVKPTHCSGFPNAWRFPGWREQCEAIEVEGKPSAS